MNRIKELRIKKGWTQTDLADKLNTGKNTISRYETEQRQLDTETLFKLCDIFGVTADYLLGRSPVPVAQISDEDWLLLDAYHRATLRDRQLVDSILQEYRAEKEKETAQ